MKKTILRLGAIATTTVPFIVASCGSTKTQTEATTKEEQDTEDVLKVEKEIKTSDKISFKSTKTTFDKAKEDLITTFINETYGCDITIENSLIKEQQGSVTFNIKKGTQNITIDKTIIWTDLEAKKERYTIYKMSNGKEIISKKHDLSRIKGKDITIIQIGYKHQARFNHSVTMDRFPWGTISVPKKLPIYIKVTERAFFKCKKFNQNLSSWNTSRVTNMESMFSWCENFNGNIANWDTSSVKNMTSMFFHCKKFNQDLSSWKTTQVTDMSFMFIVCKKFNQNLSSWNTSRVTNMEYMFEECSDFNQNLSGWNVKKVTRHKKFSYKASKLKKEPKWNK